MRPGKRKICIDQMGVRIEICLQIEEQPILVKTAKIKRDRALCQKQFVDRIRICKERQIGAPSASPKPQEEHPPEERSFLRWGGT